MTASTTPIEVEARLSSPSGGSGRGEVEYEVHLDGGESFECTVLGVAGSRGSTVTVLRNGEPIAQMILGGFFKRVARLDVSSRHGDPVPSLAIGDLIEVVAGAELMLAGTTRPD